MGYKIAVIAPFPKMVQAVEEVLRERAAELSGTIEVFLGDSQEGVEQARRAAARGVEVLISRGGTAQAISEAVAVPVVQIQVTALDILHALKQARFESDRVGISGFRSVIYECERLAELLGIAIHVIEVGKMEETADKIASAAKQGVKVIIGDAYSVLIAQELGLGGHVIESGKDAVYKAIKEAELVAAVRQGEQERTELLRTIVDASADGIVAIDKSERITVFNSAAARIFSVNSLNVIGQQIKEVIPGTRLPRVMAKGDMEVGEVQYVGQKMVATKRIPIKIRNEVVGAIANFQDVTQLQQYEQIIRQKLHDKGLVAKVGLDQIIGTSMPLQNAKRMARRYAASGSTVLITGESGTGKEMFAQSIHRLSSRNKNPFVAINCAAVPETLLESELMGYEEGAFTGAKKGGKQGLFELAHGGTLFLDEIGELPMSLQARLLRVLQEKEVMRLGGHNVIPVDVRIIAATNQNLRELVDGRNFRTDLYYRLNILQLHLPPLRSRAEDIPLLADHFISRLSGADCKAKKLGTGVADFLSSLYWPGNVRELANIIERAMVLSDCTEISIKGVKDIFGNDLYSVLPLENGCGQELPKDMNKLEAVERQTIAQILYEERGNLSRAARRLGIGRTTLWRRLQRNDAKEITKNHSDTKCDS